MIGLVLAAAAVGAVAGQLEVIPSATVESRVGEAPIIYGKPPEASLVEVLTPGAELAYVGQRLEFRTSYELRIFWRATSQDPHPTPLYLNTLNLAAIAHPTRPLTLKLTGSAYEGEADYTYLPAIYGQNQATLVVVPRIFSLNVTGNADLRVSRVVTAGLALQAAHNQPLGETQTTGMTTSPLIAPTITPPSRTVGPTPGYTLPHFTSFAATPGAAVRLSRTDDLAPAIAFEYQQISSLAPPIAPGTTQPAGTAQPRSSISAFIAMPTLGFHRLLPLHSEFTLKIGVALTHLDATATGESNSIGPVAGAEVDARLMNVRQAILHAKASTALEYYLDPVLGTPATHALGIGSLYLGLPQNWTIGLQGAFVSSLQPHPYGTAPNLIYPDEVAAEVDLPIRHLLSKDLLLEFGGRWADRSPFFTAPTYGFHQRQLWLYVMLTGTTRPTWQPQRTVAAPP